jgi:hypothetical protein
MARGTGALAAILLVLSACLAAAGSPQLGAGRVLLGADGRTRGLVLPIEHRPGRPRGLLRKGSLPIHGAVHEGCV